MIAIELDWRSPYDAFAPLAGVPFAHLLHGGDLAVDAEWSLIVAFPANRMMVEGRAVYLDGARVDEDPFDLLERLARAREVKPSRGGVAAPFGSGFVGFVGYEAAAIIEPTLTMPSSPFPLPDIAFGAYDAAAVFNRRERKAWVVGVDRGACERLCDALGRSPSPIQGAHTNWRTGSNFTRDEYLCAVADTIERIRDGAIFQANLSQQLGATCDGEVSAFHMFRDIASRSDARHGAFLQFEYASIISNSPERFFQIAPGETVRRISVEPIKGTRARGATPALDADLAEELRQDPKDRAENIMIADLMRNDLSKICADHSISEDEICSLLSLSRVHHLVSKISGNLRADIEIGACFRALFPSGSITGAPKVEAMKVIAAAENVGRGPYCGAIGYIDDAGGADFSVAIRTMMLDQQGGVTRATYPVGGGITLRSSPALEFDETMIKARDYAAGFGAKLDDAP